MTYPAKDFHKAMKYGDLDAARTALDVSASVGGGGDGVTYIDAPLTSLSDSRGPLGARCYDADDIVVYEKVSIDPHTWIAINASNA